MTLIILQTIIKALLAHLCFSYMPVRQEIARFAAAAVLLPTQLRLSVENQNPPKAFR